MLRQTLIPLQKHPLLRLLKQKTPVLQQKASTSEVMQPSHPMHLLVQKEIRPKAKTELLVALRKILLIKAETVNHLHPAALQSPALQRTKTENPPAVQGRLRRLARKMQKTPRKRKTDIASSLFLNKCNRLT